MKKLYVSLLFCVFLSNQALAETVAHGAADAHASGAHADAGHHGSSGGLPQLDPTSFPSQLFWLAVVFGFMFFFFSKKSLPEISGIIEGRKERVQNDLDEAQRLRDEVAAAQTAYEESLAGARQESSSIFKATEEEIKSNSESQLEDMRRKSATQIASMEKRVASAVDDAMENIGHVAADIAVEAAAKIIGLPVDIQEARQVVAGINDSSKQKSSKAA